MRRRWRRRSVRLRLTIWYSVTLLVILLVYAGGVYAFLSHSLYAELDRRLDDDFEVAEEMLVSDGNDGIRWLAAGRRVGKELSENRWLEVWGESGLLYIAGPEEGSLDLPSPWPIPEHDRSGTVRAPVGWVRQLTGRDSVAGRAVVIRVARAERQLRGELRQLLLVLVFGLPLAVGIASVGGSLLARRALAPAARMAERATTITAERLSGRLRVENPDDELGRLATVFNETFARLESSFEELRRFTADASHELRTPLTTMRTVGEVGLREARDGRAYREIIGSMLEEVDRLGRLVDSLLTLSRADSGQVQIQPGKVDLAELAYEVADYLSVLAEEKNQSISIASRAPAFANVDRAVLRRALVNLVDNAVKYSPEGATIKVVVDERNHQSTLEVIDSGPGIPAEHRARIFDRFYRVGKGRSREGGGTGLGLAIVRWAVEANLGRIELGGEPGGGAVFRIVLPAVEAATKEP